MQGATAMMGTNQSAPHIGDMVHYWPVLTELQGCRAAVVTGTHVDPHLASLMVLHTTGCQFLEEIRQAELDPLMTDPLTDKYVPGTWHVAAHQ